MFEKSQDKNISDLEAADGFKVVLPEIDDDRLADSMIEEGDSLSETVYHSLFQVSFFMLFYFVEIDIISRHY